MQLIIRYSGAPADRRPLKVRLSVNGKANENELLLQPAANWGNQWRTAQQRIAIRPGANTIRLTTVDGRGLLIDEIAIQ